jgi:NAD(P)-dependent dehydrogenase (short-subunit alcohol dehydrogenase family)
MEQEIIVSLLTGRVAIVTGASKGIGRVMSQLFAREGAKVVCGARSEALVNETVALIRSTGGDAVAVVADAGTEAGARAIVDAGVTTFGGLDTLVNNAGDGGPTKPVQDYTVEDWFYTVNSCLTSAYLCSRFAVPPMIAAGRGAIVNIASMAGRRGLAYRVGYCSAKAGQIGMTYGLALELGRHNITGNCAGRGRGRSDRSRHQEPGRCARCRRRAHARILRRTISAAAHVDCRRHRCARDVSLQRSRPEYFGAVHSGYCGRARVVTIYNLQWTILQRGRAARFVNFKL